MASTITGLPDILDCRKLGLNKETNKSYTFINCDVNFCRKAHVIIHAGATLQTRTSSVLTRYFQALYIPKTEITPTKIDLPFHHLLLPPSSSQKASWISAFLSWVPPHFSLPLPLPTQVNMQIPTETVKNAKR